MYLVEIAFAESKACSVLYSFFFFQETYSQLVRKREKWGKKISEIKTQVSLRLAVP